MLIIHVIMDIFAKSIKHVWRALFIFHYFISTFTTRYHGAMVIVKGNGHGDPSSNPGVGCLHFM